MEAPLTVDKVCEMIGKTPADLAEIFCVTPMAIRQWQSEGFPPGRAIELEHKFNGQLKASDLKVRVAKKRGPAKKRAKKRRPA